MNNQPIQAGRRSPFVNGRWQPSPGHAPVVISIIVVAVVAVLLTSLGSSTDLTAALMMVDPRQYPLFDWAERLSALADTLSKGQVWRLITPDFLHFSWTHIIFNSVMLWFLGSQIEVIDGRTRLLILALVASLLSNSLQYMVSGPLFGGLSGVVYATLGYCWLSQRRLPRFQFPPALITFALGWMLLGFTPLPKMLGMGNMANEAHLGGFIAGLLVAVIIKKPHQKAGH